MKLSITNNKRIHTHRLSQSKIGAIWICSILIALCNLYDAKAQMPIDSVYHVITMESSSDSIMIPKRLYRFRPDSTYERNTGYIMLDSINNLAYRLKHRFESKKDSTLQNEHSKWEKIGSITMDVLFGRNFNLPKRWILGVDGLIFAFPEVNNVDGLWCGYEVYASNQPEPGYRISARANAYYLTKRKTMVWHNYLTYHYAPMKNGMLLIGFGRTTANANLLNGKQMYLNYYNDPALGNEPTRIYDRRFWIARNELELRRWLGLDLTLLFEKRRAMIPTALFEKQYALASEIRLRISPWARKLYSTTDEAVYVNPVGMLYPQFEFSYRRGWPLGSKIPSCNYSRIETQIKGIIPFGKSRELQYTLGYGRYLKSKCVSEQDEKYVTTSNTVGFTHLPSTFQSFAPAQPMGHRWSTAYFTYRTEHLFLGSLAEASHLPFDEAIHLRFAHRIDPANKMFTEVGYSIGAGDLIRIGAFVGFEDNHHTSITLRLALPIFQLLRSWGERN